MNLGELFKTKRWKTFMGYVYGWGAAVVMVGALFKLQHWEYSGILLTVGLLTEAFIFFLSAFEPHVEMPDWAKVYPELKEDYEMSDINELAPKKKGLGELFSSSEMTPELMERVGKGLNDLSNTAKGISDISTATLATDMYVKNMGSASESMSSLAEINNKANSSLNQSVDVLVESYSATAQKLSEGGIGAIEKIHKSGETFSNQLAETGKRLAQTYDEVGSSVSTELNKIKDSSSQYSGNLEKLNGNLSALNTNFETQIKETNEQFKANSKFTQDIGEMNNILASSVNELKKYKDNAEQLNKHLESLNQIYGNMLGAMNYKK